MHATQSEFEDALLQYDKAKAFKIFNSFLSENNNSDFIDKIIVTTLIAIGEKWENSTIALSQIYMSSKICEEFIELLLPKDLHETKVTQPIAIVTLEDHHNLGKKIVTAVLRSAGYLLEDYGSGISVEEVIERAIKDDLGILIISVLMYPSALKIKKVTDILHKRKPSIKILVGGAPFLIDPTLWEITGADAVGMNASSDIPIIEKWTEGGICND